MSLVILSCYKDASFEISAERKSVNTSDMKIMEDTVGTERWIRYN